MSARSRPTVFDVARAANASIATVSRVMNGRPVSDTALAQRVRRAADELGYRPNMVARDFRDGVTHTIGVVVPDLANPFFPEVVKGLAREVTASGHRLLVADTDEDVREELRVIGELAGRCDGIVLCSPRMPDSELVTLAGFGIPIVCTNREARGVPLTTIGIDSATGMSEAVEHLSALGHRHVGYLAGPASSWSDAQRRTALHHAAHAHHVRVTVVAAGSTSAAGHRALPDLLRHRVTAVLAFNDLVALGALARLREVGRTVPADLSVVGFDDIPVAEFVAPPLTTVRLPTMELGRRAGGLLRELLIDGGTPREERLASSLVVRNSTAPPA